MKQDIINTTKLLIALIAILYFSIPNAKAGEVTQTQSNQTYQANQSNVGNKTEYNQTYKDSGNYIGNTWANTTTTVQSNVNASQQNQYTDSSETKITDSYNKTEVNDHSGSNNELKAYGGDANSKSYSEGGDAKAYGGESYSDSNSKSTSNSDGGAASSSSSTGPITVNNGVGGQQQPNLTIRHQGLVQAPNLAPLIGYVSQNEGSCMYSNGGSASGSNGMASGGLSILFGLSDDNCETLQRVKFLMSAGAQDTACELLLIYDQEERDGYFAKAVNRTGGCNRFKPVAPVAVAPIVSPIAANTQERLNSLKSPNSLIDQQFNQGMIK